MEGNTVLPDERVQSTLAPFAGEDRDFADVQHALEALESLYRTAGYGALQVYLPEQELNQGVVVFKVVEPHVGKVRIEGNQYFGADNVRRAMPALQEGQVPNTLALAKDLRLANESPSRHITATMQAGEDPQKMDVNVKVDDEKPWRAFLSADNSGTSEGRARVSVGFQDSNMFDRDQVLTAQATTSPTEADKVKIFGLGYKIPFYRWGDSLSVYGGYSNVTSGALGGLFDVSGKGDVGGVRYSETLPDWGDRQQHLQWGYDWRKFDTSVAHGKGFASDYIVHPVSLAYLTQWQGQRWSYDWNVSLNHNISNGNLAQTAGRVDASANYSIVRYGGNVYVSVAGEWMAHVALTGQWTNDALASGEQFGIGGANSVRGYEERALSDDSGVTTNLEGYTPDVAAGMGWKGWSLRGLAFADYGRVTRNHAQPGEVTEAELASAGLGLRMGIGKTATLKVDVACPLKEGGGTKKDDVRAHVLATVSY
ncbi:MAG: ShlB/FhaC/HecB family hemolysin secretion/activation protein [Burkholderiales bacterium]|nr:ShlB/FhaC/HecB family hemolysin secretion/activation protein [Burkholderiales bacterium]